MFLAGMPSKTDMHWNKQRKKKKSPTKTTLIPPSQTSSSWGSRKKIDHTRSSKLPCFLGRPPQPSRTLFPDRNFAPKLIFISRPPPFLKVLNPNSFSSFSSCFGPVIFPHEKKFDFPPPPTLLPKKNSLHHHPQPDNTHATTAAGPRGLWSLQRVDAVTRRRKEEAGKKKK